MDALFAQRLAGAVYSLTYDGFEYVPLLPGNGGSLQASSGMDIEPGEPYVIENPNEAGNNEDNNGATTSVWTEAAASDTTVYTSCQMAYWYPPGTLTDGINVQGSVMVARGWDGANKVSDTVFNKRVTALGPGVLKFTCSFVLPARHRSAVFEPLAFYTAGILENVHLLKPTTTELYTGGGIYSQKAGGDANVRAVMLADPDGLRAAGATVTGWPWKMRARHADPNYPMLKAIPFSSATWAPSLSKINFAWTAGKASNTEADATIPDGPWTFEFVIAVGALASVEAAMRTHAVFP